MNKTQSPEKISADNGRDKDSPLDLYGASQRNPPTKELSIAIAPPVEPRSTNTPTLPTGKFELQPVELPARSRSPLRRKAVQLLDGSITSDRGRADTSSFAQPEVQSQTIIPTSEAVEPSPRQPIQLSSRNHSSGTRKRVKAVQTRADDDDSNDNIPSEESLPYRPVHDRRGNAFVPAEISLPAPATAESQQTVMHSTLPSEFRMLNGSRKRLPLNGSESSLVQSLRKETIRSGPSSPPVTARSLSPSSQVQSLPKPRQTHSQHKRLPTPEVMQVGRLFYNFAL